MFKPLGHALLGAMFITGGAKAFSEPGGRVAMVEKAGIPAAREATILNGAVMMVFGSALAVNLLPKLAATALIGSLAVTTAVGHAFWKEESPAARANQQTQFLKNLAMLGGLILVLDEH